MLILLKADNRYKIQLLILNCQIKCNISFFFFEQIKYWGGVTKYFQKKSNIKTKKIRHFA